MGKEKGRQSPFAKEKRELSLRYGKFEVHGLSNWTRFPRCYDVRLNHWGGNKARQLETAVDSLIQLICILVTLASRRMSNHRPPADVSWCPTARRRTQPTHLFFSWSASCGLGSIRTQGTGAAAVLCTERILQSLGQKTKYFLFIYSNSLARKTKWVRKIESLASSVRLPIHTRGAVWLVACIGINTKRLKYSFYPKERFYSMQIKREFCQKVRPSISQNTNVYLKEFLNSDSD